MTFAIANYIQHQRELIDLLNPRCARRFLFIEGPRDYGKTLLLNWLDTNVQQPSLLLYFDLGASHQILSPALILATSASRIGKSHMTRFAAHQRALQSRPISASASGNTVTGRNITLIATAVGETAEEKLYNAIEMTDHFVEDLVELPASFPPIVFAFDGYDHAKPDQAMLLINQWLDQSFLPSLARASCSRLILAGRAVPNPSAKAWSAWSASIKLQGVRETNEWMEVVKKLKKRYPPIANGNPVRYLEIVIDTLQGIPGPIMTIVQSFPSEETASG